MEKIRESVRTWLQITEPTAGLISITPTLDFYGNASKNRIWYRGDSEELSQLYGQLPGDRTRFWAATSTPGLEIRKIHTGLPGLMVDMLSAISIAKYHCDISDDKAVSELWEAIEDDNSFRDILEQAVKDCLVVGDGAFKISFDAALSDYPIIEWYAGDSVEYVTDRGRIREIIFKTPLNDGKADYVLHEHYGRGYVEYELMRDGKAVPADGLEITRDLQNVVFGGDTPYLLAVPLRFYASPRWAGRGQSIYDKKTDAFDSLDEAWSQWMDALRAGRTREYIPENILPRDPHTGEIMAPNAFDNRFIQTSADMRETAQNTIILQSPEIEHELYLATYITALDLALQGVISPSTLGIDVKKLDNGEAQREKEKATLYTRDGITDALTKAVQTLVETALRAYAEWTETSYKQTGISVDFGAYANPSFESMVETVAKARMAGVMSIEASVDELYGDDRDAEWKAQEVARLQAERGLTSLEEPSAGMDVDVDALVAEDIGNQEGDSSDDSDSRNEDMDRGVQGKDSGLA